jgi:hypothetical protein
MRLCSLKEYLLAHWDEYLWTIFFDIFCCRIAIVPFIAAFLHVREAI